MDDSIRSRVPAQWDDQLERIRKQLPPAPEGLLGFYVKWVPWVAIVFGAIGLIIALGATVLSVILGPLMAAFGGVQGATTGIGLILGSLLLLVVSILSVVGGIKMRQLSVSGWWILAASIVIGAVQDLLTLSLLGLIIAVLIAYIHLSVKPRYT